MKSKLIRCLTVVAGCVCLIVLCVGMEHLVKVKAETETEQESYQKHEEYNGYGLPMGTELSDEITYSNEQLIYYSDRAFYHFQYESDSIENVADMIVGLLKVCPQLRKVYLMPVPPRILIENGYEADKQRYKDYVDALKRKIPYKAILVESGLDLEQHKDEYIFFRTEEAWTTRGAYYGAVALLKKMGKEYVSLNKYEEHVYTGFLGNMTLIPGPNYQVMQNIPVDPMYYYVLPDTPQRVEIINIDNMGRKESYKKPLFSPSLRNLATVIEGNYVRAIVDGECKFGEDGGNNLLIIADNAGKLIVPYLKDYYDTIYVINIYEDNMLYEDISRIIEEYQIKEAVIVQNASNFGVAGYHLAMKKFYQLNQNVQDSFE